MGHECFDHGYLTSDPRVGSVRCGECDDLLALPHQVDHAAWGFDKQEEQADG